MKLPLIWKKESSRHGVVVDSDGKWIATVNIENDPERGERVRQACEAASAKGSHEET